MSGYRIASSVGGIVTGEHPDLISVDDPLNAKDATSDAVLRACTEWLKSSVFSRMANNPSIGIVQQRLSDRDPSGYVMDREEKIPIGDRKTTFLVLPMHYASKPVDRNDKRPIPDPRDKRTQDGELLFPGLYDEEKVKLLEIELLEQAPGQLEQMPVAVGGALLKRSDIQVIDQIPDGVHIQWTYRFWDTAGTENAGCLTSSTKAGFTADDKMYILHWTGDQIGVEDVDVLMHSTAYSDGKHVFIREERQGAAAGKALTTTHKRQLEGFEYDEVVVTRTGDKIVRSRPFRSECKKGNVFLVVGSWDHEGLLDHLCAFPFGKYSDPMDSTSGCWNSFVKDRDEDKLYTTKLTFGKGRERRMKERRGGRR
jgi:predicted phage terminase large subunit-like protein